MKKILFSMLVLLVMCANCEAKDYAKMHMKQMKKNQNSLAIQMGIGLVLGLICGCGFIGCCGGITGCCGIAPG